MVQCGWKELCAKGKKVRQDRNSGKEVWKLGAQEVDGTKSKIIFSVILY